MLKDLVIYIRVTKCSHYYQMKCHLHILIKIWLDGDIGRHKALLSQRLKYIILGINYSSRPYYGNNTSFFLFQETVSSLLIIMILHRIKMYTTFRVERTKVLLNTSYLFFFELYTIK